MKFVYVLLISLVLLVGCKDKPMDAQKSGEAYLKAMFIDNDIDAIKKMTHPDQVEDFTRSIGGLANMLVLMDDASYEIKSVKEDGDLAVIAFDISMTSKGKTEFSSETMTLQKIDSVWYVK
ncbi:hypothetical protein [Marinicellulosiphila megalodicopiae]|uniref:hypothetical protein n=1 Tax=Marinicellulosiphila megalodicopiae TaxID=2724896 RepID=UPI003BAE5DAE